MADTLPAVLGIAILLAIGLVAWRLAWQVRRQSEDAHASEVPGIAGRKGGSPVQPGMSVTDQTIFAQHTSTRATWDVASGGDGSA